MVQGGSKRKGCALHDKEKDGASWCSFKSILDVKLSSPSDLPDPPINLYLEEVPLGMRGGPGDAVALANDSSSVRQAQSMARVFTRSCAEKACRALLWLAVGGVFGHLDKEGLAQFREALGENWYLLSLAVSEDAGRDRKLQDMVSAALPFVFAQAIYRALCDGFVEDRKIFVSNADKLICKLTQVVHFETTGFQMTTETVRRGRRRLLQKHIFKHPNTNQREFLRGQRRQEMLESQNVHVGDQPLRFGDQEAHPLEETQLDHVMQGMLEDRSQPRLVRKAESVPPELSVDRYAHLSDEGAALLERQLEEFAEILGETDDDEEPEQVAPEDILSAPSTPMSPQRPGAAWASAANTAGTLASTTGGASTGTQQQLGMTPVADLSHRPSVSFRDHPIASDDEGSDAPLSPSSLSPLARLRKASGLGGRRNSLAAVVKLNLVKAQSRDRKVKEEKARKLRQEQLLRKICQEKLPDELCTREFSTTWVSPCQMALMKGEDRNCLTKPSAESHMLKMETRPMLVRPLSMPALRAKSGEQKKGANETMTVSGGSGGNTKDEGSQAGTSASKIPRAGHGRANSTVGISSTDGTALPRVPSAGGGLHGSGAARLWATRGETISVEPPPRLSAKVIMRRLEDQAKASKQMSFAIYMKEYDIFTNMLKKSVDEKRLRDEEDACLRRSDALLSGPPKRRLAPEDLRMKGGTKQPSSA